MSTITLKRSFWKDFQRTRTWKYIFLVLDGIMLMITWMFFFLFALIFADHSAKTVWGFYSPMVLLLVFILALASIVMCNYTALSWLAIVGIDILLAIVLYLCAVYPIWSNNYREKMGYPTLF